MQLITDFIFVGGILGILLMIYRLYTARPRQLPHFLLILIFSFVLVIVLNFYADLHELRGLFLATLLFEDGSRFILAPLIYLYVKSLFEEEKGFFKKHFFHFIPFVLYLMIITLPVVLRVFYPQFDFNYLQILKKTQNLTILKDLYFLTYISFSLQLFIRLRKKMKWNYSSFTDKDFGWVKQMLLCALIVIAIDIMVLIAELFYDFFDWDTGYITAIAMILVVCYLGYFGIKQTKVFLPDFLLFKEERATKYQSKTEVSPLSYMSESEIEELKVKLKTAMAVERLYLNQDLTLNKLSKHLEISERTLSALINQSMGTTFYDLVNGFRVQALKERLNSPDYKNYTLLGIAFECGFKSKSSFYRVFKKHVGTSPKVFKNQIEGKS